MTNIIDFNDAVEKRLAPARKVFIDAGLMLESAGAANWLVFGVVDDYVLLEVDKEFSWDELRACRDYLTEVLNEHVDDTPR